MKRAALALVVGRRAALALLLAGSGCRGILGIDENPHVAGDASDALACSAWAPRRLDACAMPAPAPPLVLKQSDSPYTLDTTTRTLRSARGAVEMSWAEVAQADQSKVFVVATEQLTVEAAARLEVIGKLPLVLASWSTIEVGGTIDAGSHLGRQVGPGANMSCGALTGTNGVNAPSTGGSGGGGGGAFRGRGGAGGAGGAAQSGGGGGGLAAVTPQLLRGGCAGGSSGEAGSSAVTPSGAATTSLGGAGGGAILLAAREMIAVHATAAVLAGGAGGAGAQEGSKCGGGGGGAGGYVGLAAELVDLRGTLAANGGAGGGSAPWTAVGGAGQDAQPTDRAAVGGPSAPSCGAGGAGAAATVAEGGIAGANTMCGGGGGGGGSGFVMVWSAHYQKQPSALVSPTELLNMP